MRNKVSQPALKRLKRVCCVCTGALLDLWKSTFGRKQRVNLLARCSVLDSEVHPAFSSNLAEIEGFIAEVPE